MQIEIWSDVVCPWCYIGKRRFEQALAQFEGRDDVHIVWRSFELDPDAPPQYPGTLDDLLSSKYDVSGEEAAGMNDRVTRMAAEAGLEYHLERARPGNTFDAHRLIHYANSKGVGERAMEGLMHAYFSDSLPVGDREALIKLAPGFGIAEEEARSVLESENWSEEVRADENRAKELGIGGVPFFVLNEQLGVSGAQPVEVFADALRQAASPAKSEPDNAD